MRKFIKLFGIFSRLIFELVFTYLMVALLGLGFNGILWIGVIAGLIGIVYGLTDLFQFITEDEAFIVEQLDEEDAPLYYVIDYNKKTHGYFFIVYAKNHEFICQSDEFKTHDGAVTGLWYLMDSMQRMDHTKWEER